MKTKLLGFAVVVLGVFMLAGIASAEEIVLQPAGDFVTPGSGTTFLESIRVGVAGQGGVTFFNGSILNESGPMVIADDLRVDGEIYRTEKGGEPIKISDNIIPTMDATNDFGTPDKRWRRGYFSEEVKVGNSVIIDSTKITSTKKIVIDSLDAADPTDLSLDFT